MKNAKTLSSGIVILLILLVSLVDPITCAKSRHNKLKANVRIVDTESASSSSSSQSYSDSESSTSVSTSEDILFGIYVLANTSAEDVDFPMSEITCDGELPEKHYVFGFALSLFGDTDGTKVLESENPSSSSEEEIKSTPSPKKARKMPLGAFGRKMTKSEAQSLPKSIEEKTSTVESLRKYNMYKGFFGSPNEVLSVLVLNSNPSLLWDAVPFNGVEMTNQMDHYVRNKIDLNETVMEEGVDMKSFNWSRVSTTYMTAIKVAELPQEIRVYLGHIYEDYFGEVHNISVLSVNVAFDIPDEITSPKYTAEINQKTMEAVLTIDPNWYKGHIAARKRAEKISKLHAGEVNIDGLRLRSAGLISEEAAETETTPVLDRNILVLSMEVGFARESELRSVDNNNELKTHKYTSDEGNVKQSNSYLSIRKYRVPSKPSVSTLFPTQFEATNVYVDPHNNLGGPAIIFSPVITFSIILVIAAFFLGTSMGNPYGFEIIIRSSVARLTSTRDAEYPNGKDSYIYPASAVHHNHDESKRPRAGSARLIPTTPSDLDHLNAEDIMSAHKRGQIETL